MVAPRPLYDDDLVFDAKPSQCVKDPLDRRLEPSPIMLDDGRLYEDSTIEVSKHHLRAVLGEIDTEKGKMFRTNRSDTWMDHAPWFVNGMRAGLAGTLWNWQTLDKDLQKRVGTETNNRSGNLFGSTVSRIFTARNFCRKILKTRSAVYQATHDLAQRLRAHGEIRGRLFDSVFRVWPVKREARRERRNAVEAAASRYCNGPVHLQEIRSFSLSCRSGRLSFDQRVA